MIEQPMNPLQHGNLALEKRKFSCRPIVARLPSVTNRLSKLSAAA
jgi:hypothetical protein